MISRIEQFLKEIKYAPVEKFIQCAATRDRQPVWLSKYQHWKRARRPALHRQIIEVTARYPDSRAVIVFTPGLDWERQLFQRPQQLAKAFAKQGALVFYTQLSARGSRTAPIRQIGDRLYLCSLPLEMLSTLPGLYVYTMTWNRKYLLKFNQPHILYDYLDEISAFQGDHAQLVRDHLRLMRDAEIVTATAQQLLEDTRTLRSDVLYVPNGVDYDHFQQENIQPLPQDFARICEDGKPVVGYYGAFASWFDYPLVSYAAQKHAGLNFIMIGTKHDSSLEASGLLKLPNVHYLGPKPYSELPTYLSRFQCAILPFRVNKVTQSTSPIKLFEYFAGGKPVVSTPLREVMQYPEVFIGENSDAFSAKIDEAVSKAEDAGFISQLKQLAQANTWEMRAEKILQAMEEQSAPKKIAGLSKD